MFALHKRMFEDVWRWAGTQHRRGTNIGVEPSQIAMQTKQTMDDVAWWHENNRFGAAERAARIHGRLVAIHPFANGNGRCTRLVADLYLVSIGILAFTWGAGGRLDAGSDTRRRYPMLSTRRTATTGHRWWSSRAAEALAPRWPEAPRAGRGGHGGAGF